MKMRRSEGAAGDGVADLEAPSAIEFPGSVGECAEVVRGSGGASVAVFDAPAIPTSWTIGSLAMTEVAPPVRYFSGSDRNLLAQLVQQKK
jgi:hypothetical protein